MVPQKPRNVSVRFTETFLRDFQLCATDEEQLRLLALVIAENPSRGKACKEIDSLRSVPWVEGTTVLRIWYLYYPTAAHIEVVAITRPDDAFADARNVRRAVWWVMRIGLALRLGYRVYQFVDEHVWPLFSHLM
jgi:hypothetical protein